LAGSVLEAADAQRAEAPIRASQLPPEAGHHGGVGQLLVEGHPSARLQKHRGIHGNLLSGGQPLQREAHLVLRQPRGPAEGQGRRLEQAAEPVERGRQQHLAPRQAHVFQDDVPARLLADQVTKATKLVTEVVNGTLKKTELLGVQPTRFRHYTD